jgi:hypothetical protein
MGFIFEQIGFKGWQQRHQGGSKFDLVLINFIVSRVISMLLGFLQILSGQISSMQTIPKT